MTFFDLFWAADWDGLYRFFTFGNPPLILQLLAINTVFLFLYLFRNMRTKYKMRPSNMQIVQTLLVVANTGIIFQDFVWKWLNPHIIQRLI